MKRTVLLSGGNERANGFELGEGKYYQSACLLELDLDTGELTERIRLDEGNQNYPDEHPNLLFTAAAIDGRTIWLPTHGEVLAYSLDNWQLLKRFSVSVFHNNHSVAVFGERLYITATGTDMVVVMDKSSGDVLEQINVTGKDIWHRFDKNVDYRKIHSTKPHQGHPNYVFQLNGEYWVTRCSYEDAACLNDVSKRINISDDPKMSYHDGFDYGDYIYFTSVDGCLHGANKATREIDFVIDLNKGQSRKHKGWCRGLWIEDDIAYVGFSKIRRTRNQSRVEWLKKSLGNQETITNSAVLVYDLNKRKLIKSFDFEPGVLDAVYSILPSYGQHG